MLLYNLYYLTEVYLPEELWFEYFITKEVRKFHGDRMAEGRQVYISK
jgi:hypothetical protein